MVVLSLVYLVLCVIVGCSKCSGRDKDVSFFRIPKVVQPEENIVKLSKKRREGFLAAISKLADKINDRICSRHFICGKPAYLLDETSPNWLPSSRWGSKSKTPAP